MSIRLNKFIADSGITSRRKADELISSGHVFVNGKPAKVGDTINPNEDIIKFNDKEIKPQNKTIIYALYKPKGIVTTAYDELGRQNVIDFVPETPRVFPVGRLDKDSEGLILLTNDGELTQKLTHPSFEHEKEYELEVNQIHKVYKDEIQKAFLNGMKIDGKLMKVDAIDIQSLASNSYCLTINMHTGYNRQLRKMCDKIGLKVIRLTRIRIGKLKLSDLKLEPGQYIVIEQNNIL